MSSRSERWVESPQQLTLTEPVHRAQIRVVGGTVNVVGLEPSATPRLEISALDGPPLRVVQEGGSLTVAYEDVPWQGFLKLLDGEGRRRSADVTLAVPASADVRVAVVGADAVVSRITGRTEIRGISGGTTLVGLRGPAHAHTVSGGVEAQGLAGDLTFHSVSGTLTVIDGGAGALRADTVTGDLIVDVSDTHGAAFPEAPGEPRDHERGSVPGALCLTSVSGEIAIRLPQRPDAVVEAHTGGGSLSCGFDDLRVSGQWGAKRLTGTLGSGRGSVKATTVSGRIALLRRSPSPTDAPSFAKDA
ncbi:DUF4097 family beta strand repeat-containing protein [Streptomyces sp. GSL17-111]|uniref:DUF4097 family beta strand repeat-containing protein n=1 Tax=Streptomyces sp. GSL17-111 TaxID=3121596 RepID=UPI0030F41219